MELSNAQAEMIVKVILGIVADWQRTPEPYKESVRAERQKSVTQLIEIHGNPVGVFLAIFKPSTTDEPCKQWVLPLIARIHSSELVPLLGDCPLSALYTPLADIELKREDASGRFGRMKVYGGDEFAGYTLRVCSTVSAAQSHLSQLELRERQERELAQQREQRRQELWGGRRYHD